MCELLCEIECQPLTYFIAKYACKKDTGAYLVCAEYAHDSHESWDGHIQEIDKRMCRLESNIEKKLEEKFNQLNEKLANLEEQRKEDGEKL